MFNCISNCCTNLSDLCPSIKIPAAAVCDFLQNSPLPGRIMALAGMILAIGALLTPITSSLETADLIRYVIFPHVAGMVMAIAGLLYSGDLNSN